MATPKKVVKVESEPVASCRECRFSKNLVGDGLYCRRYPPVFVYEPSRGLTEPRFPEVNPQGWCGCFAGHLSS
jgi:hypothetical protein